MDNSKENIASNTLWKMAERITAQGVSFLVSLILARLLLPEDYGLVALVNIFITLATVIVTFGINTALIQNKEADDIDFSTAFFLNIVLGAGLYFVLFMLAPYVARLYENDTLTLLIRVLSLTIPIYSINSIQQAYISKRMEFKKFFTSTIIGTIISAIVGIVMAYEGYGVWALVAQTLISNVLGMLILFLTTQWRPRLVFSTQRAKGIAKYGTAILGAQMINRLYSELKGLIIGKVYTSADLSYYNKGKQIPMLIETNFDLSIASVIFTSFAYEQDNKNKFLMLYKKAIRVSTFITFPMLLGIFAVADNLIYVLYSEKWMGCVEFLRIMCVSFLFYGIDSTSVLAMRALGNAKEGIWIEMIHKMLMLGIIIGSLKINIYALVATEIVANLLHVTLVLCILKKSIGYGMKDMFVDCLKNFLSASFMAVVVILCDTLIDNQLLCLITQVLIGAGIYFGLAVLLKNDAYRTMLELVENKFLARRSET